MTRQLFLQLWSYGWGFVGGAICGLFAGRLMFPPRMKQPAERGEDHDG